MQAAFEFLLTTDFTTLGLDKNVVDTARPDLLSFTKDQPAKVASLALAAGKGLWRTIDDVKSIISPGTLYSTRQSIFKRTSTPFAQCQSGDHEIQSQTRLCSKEMSADVQIEKCI